MTEISRTDAELVREVWEKLPKKGNRELGAAGGVDHTTASRWRKRIKDDSGAFKISADARARLERFLDGAPDEYDRGFSSALDMVKGAIRALEEQHSLGFRSKAKATSPEISHEDVEEGVDLSTGSDNGRGGESSHA